MNYNIKNKIIFTFSLYAFFIFFCCELNRVSICVLTGSLEVIGFDASDVRRLLAAQDLDEIVQRVLELRDSSLWPLLAGEVGILTTK